MIQGLLGESSSSSGLINGGSSEISKLPIPSLSPSSSATAAASTTTENLRCPRCDSTNTKFCYYNNYNLTQPRHFCKTCRRYWTKGGALRNVPIGGGCRKNRTTTTTTVSSPISKSNPLIKFQKPEIGKLGNNFISSFELNELSSNPIFWASSPQNSQYLLSLLKPQNFPNSNPNLIKDEPLFPTVDSCTSLLGGLGQKQNGVVLGELQRSSGLMQDFYQRLRSSANYSNYHQGLGNIMGAADNSSSSSTILESAAVGVAADQMGYWNNPPPVLSNWSDLPTSTHGAYPN